MSKIFPFFILILLVCFSTAGCSQGSESQAELPPAEEISASQKELEEAPDEMLSSFTVSGYSKGGKKQWDLEGKSADIMTEEIKLTDVICHVFGNETNMTIVGEEGSLNRQSNNVHLEQNVRATTDDGATLTTDYLDWDAQNQKLSSDAPVWVERGMMQAWGRGIIGQPTLNFVQLKKDVTVEILLDEKTAAEESNSETADTLPTVITCNGPLEVEYEKNLAKFYDNVKVKDERGEIFSDRMDVYFATQSEEAKQAKDMQGLGIDKIFATGNVEIHHGGNISYSQKAVYDTTTGKLTLTGEPKLVIYSTEAFSQLMGGQSQK